jgi:hypothetical protein
MRSTAEAEMRLRMSSRFSLLVVGRSPLISTLPAVPAKPRALSPPSSRKPGRRAIMSRAVLGRCSAKKLGG